MVVMNNIRRTLQSLKGKLIVYFLFISFIPASIISIFYYVNQSRTLETSVGDTSVIILSHVLNNIEK